MNYLHDQAVAVARSLGIRTHSRMETADVTRRIFAKLRGVRSWITLNVRKAGDGGPGYRIMQDLRDAGIPCRKAPLCCGSTSPLVGHVGVEVPKRFERKACKIAGVA